MNAVRPTAREPQIDAGTAGRAATYPWPVADAVPRNRDGETSLCIPVAERIWPNARTHTGKRTVVELPLCPVAQTGREPPRVKRYQSVSTGYVVRRRSAVTRAQRSTEA